MNAEVSDAAVGHMNFNCDVAIEVSGVLANVGLHLPLKAVTVYGLGFGAIFIDAPGDRESINILGFDCHVVKAAVAAERGLQ